MGYLFSLDLQSPRHKGFPLSTIEPTPPQHATGLSLAVVPGWQDQDGILREMWVRNQTPQAIAEALGRSVPAIMTRAARLGLPRRSAPGRKPGPRIGLPGDQTNPLAARTPQRVKSPAQTPVVQPQTSLRVCLMCLKKFESAGRHNRICSTCKNSAEYGSASALPELRLPVS